jgi:phenylacetic acid degradation operon negative regulatory protein
MGMADADGVVTAAEVAAVAAACGQSTEQVRSCLRRLVAEGLFIREGAGPDVRYVATESGHRALGGHLAATRLAYGQDAAGQAWDGRWRLVGYTAPETRRAARDLFRDRLIGLGGALVQGGLSVSAHPWHDAVRAEAEALGVLDGLMLATAETLDVGGISHPRDVAARLWPVEALADGYRRFVDTYSSWRDALEQRVADAEHLQDEVFLPGALKMSVAFQRIGHRDPLLPPELLPKPWPGRDARRLLLDCRRLAMSLRRRTDGGMRLFSLFDLATDGVGSPHPMASIRRAPAQRPGGPDA